MTTLVWESAKNYEYGVQKGVFYPSDDSPGLAWNGLTEVIEKLAGGELTNYSADGVTYLNFVGARYYQATVQAFSAPREFSPYVGEVEVIPGFILTKQSRRLFGFSYQTLMGESDYRIHLVYNVKAAPTSGSYATTNDSPEPVNLEWQFDATSETATNIRPSAHFWVDSNKIDSVSLASLEDILYGGDDDPRMPTVSELVGLIVPELAGV